MQREWSSSRRPIFPQLIWTSPQKWLERPAKRLTASSGSLPSRNGKCVSVQEALNLLGKLKGCWLGRRYLLSLIAYDNKGRFQYAGTLDNIRSQHVDTGVWPLWLAATHGHSNKIAEEIDDNDLAVAWFWDQPREELGGAAAFKGTPILAKGEFPPRLYHRTTHDAVLAILETQLTPGFGRSGKYHNYFAKATLDELGERGGVRANLKFEMVFDTSEVLEHAYLFETASEGILCREEVPGTCVLYIRDEGKNVTVWTRPDPQAEEEEEITIDAPLTAAPTTEPEPEFVIPDDSEDELVNVEVEVEAAPPAPLSGGQDLAMAEESSAADAEVPADTEEPVSADDGSADATMEPTEEVPETPPRAQHRRLRL